MKKIIVIGCPGSGKTTFSLKLSEKLGLPIFHLDAIWHRGDKTHISREEFDERLSEITALDAYIIDGNYSRTLEYRLIRSDTVILFDLPTNVCIQGALSRVGKKRCDMPWSESELDPRFRGEIEGFRSEKLPQIYSLLEKHKTEKEVIVFTSREDAEKFLAEC